MNCNDVSEVLIAYLDGLADVRQKQRVEDHLAACSDCHTRAEQFRAMWGALEQMPSIEPTFGFDSRVRQRLAAEPARRWFGWAVLQPRLAIAVALLAILAVWMVKSKPAQHAGRLTMATVVEQDSQQEDFNAIKNLNVLENYDVVTGMDALSELVPPSAPNATDAGQSQQY